MLRHQQYQSRNTHFFYLLDKLRTTHRLLEGGNVDLFADLAAQ
jgi:hypothetical protein